MLPMAARRQLHDISPAEVKAWFGPRATARLDERQCRTVAKKLNKLWWPGEPIKGGPKPSPDIDSYWDFAAASKAANFLLRAMPAMKQHWLYSLFFLPIESVVGAPAASQSANTARSARVISVTFPGGIALDRTAEISIRGA